jgi:predicted DNA-binding protein
MDPFADIDLDTESVWLDGAWYTRDDLAHRIKEMIEAGDFRVSRQSQALERLEGAMAEAQLVSVRLSSELVETLGATAARLGRPMGHLIREAVAYYLAAAAAYGAQETAATAAALEVDARDEATPPAPAARAPGDGRRRG